MRKLDVFNHFFPRRYFDRLMAVAPSHKDMGKRVRNVRGLHDLSERFQVMDQYGDYQQILSLPSPPIEVLAPPGEARELATLANDGLADLVRQHPDRFPGFVASLPMADPDAALAEARRAVSELGACGVWGGIGH